MITYERQFYYDSSQDNNRIVVPFILLQSTFLHGIYKYLSDPIGHLGPNLHCSKLLLASDSITFWPLCTFRPGR